ncbi:MAG TPA: hypothetical protein VFZ01_13085 [Geminicoccaceae bacterium]
MPEAAAPAAERRARLEAGILDAHARGDLAVLARLYAEAGEHEHAAARTDAACFFWTQAWIFALDQGDLTLARDLEDRLGAAGRMPPPA